VDKNRRNFLRIILVGGGTFIVGKILSPLFSKSFIKSLDNRLTPRNTNVQAFRVIEDKKVLSVYDDSGEEIFQIDKEA
jgi:hypothetical protein